MFKFLVIFIFSSSLLFSSGNKEEKFIGTTVYRFDDAFITEVRLAIEEESRGSIPVRILDGNNRQSTQNEQIESFIEDGADAIIINPVDRTASGAIIEKCRNSDVPVVFFNREPVRDDMLKWDKVYYVGARAEESGAMAAELFVDYWQSVPEADKNGDGVLQFIIIKGEPGHQDTELRTEYILRTLMQNGITLERLYEDTAMWNREEAKEKMNAYLSFSNGKAIEVVFANNDEMALGVIDALKEAGYFGDGEYIPVIGCDGIPAGIEAIKRGELLGTVFNDAEGQGDAAYRIARALAEGRTPDEEEIGYELDGHYVWVPYRKIELSDLI